MTDQTPPAAVSAEDPAETPAKPPRLLETLTKEPITAVDCAELSAAALARATALTHRFGAGTETGSLMSGTGAVLVAIADQYRHLGVAMATHHGLNRPPTPAAGDR